MNSKNLLRLLNDRLTQHDNNRKEVQSQVQKVCSEILEEADLLEEKINEEIYNTFSKVEERIFNLIEKLSNNVDEGNDNEYLIIQAQKELLHKQKYAIKQVENEKKFVNLYKLSVLREKNDKLPYFNDTDNTINKNVCAIEQLKELLNVNRESMTSAQERLTEICSERRKKAEKLESYTNKKLKLAFDQEDKRIQNIVSLLNENIDSGDHEKLKDLKTIGAMILVENQKYKYIRESKQVNERSCDVHNVITTTEMSLELFNFERRKPNDFTISYTHRGEITLSFSFFSCEEVDLLEPLKLQFQVVLSVWKEGFENTPKEHTKAYSLENGNHICINGIMMPNTTYFLKMKIIFFSSCTKWSDEIKLTTPDFSCCTWNKCPDNIDEKKKYSVDENTRTAIKISADKHWCTITGNTPFPLDKVVSWNINILRSKNNDGDCIYIGVAPSDIDQNENNYYKCGWYFDCCNSILWSGPPHRYSGKEYGPRKGNGKYIHTGDCVGVVMNIAIGKVSYVLNNKNLGTAYEGISLDKPLIPCVLLKNEGDSVDFSISKIDPSVYTSILRPSFITTQRDTWDSVTLTWDAVKEASFYQIEVDGINSGDKSGTNVFTKRRLLPDIEHIFRVRTVKYNSVSEWSDIVKERTKKSFETGWWKECPDYVEDKKKYSVDENNPRIATNITDYFCTIIGNIHIPFNKVISWNIKVLKSEGKDGGNIYIGVGPFDIDQNRYDNYEKCGWYFYCYNSKLYSGPPHNYSLWSNMKYGPRKENGEYVNRGDSVGVVMDAIKGELSFVVNGVNLGVAYEGIPLDRPLVPCVLLCHKGDSVELDASEVKENTVNIDVAVPSNITTKSNTCDSIDISWNAIEGASFYQIEVNGNMIYKSEINTFENKNLLPGIKYSFRVRAVKDSNPGGWSSVVKERTQEKNGFSGSIWKECPDDVEEKMKYSIDEDNPRIATKSTVAVRDRCTIIGNTHIPLNKLISWNIKILKSRDNNGGGIYIGVAPFDINQNEDNYDECGWYFYCSGSTLRSGPPHKYGWKEYGPRKKKGGKYVHTGDNVGVVMNTVKGELSFVLQGVNCGVAYEGIPLDKPLVPCVLLGIEGDSVELVI